MAQSTLSQILSRLGTLDPEELRRLSQAVQERLSPHEEAGRREAFHEALIASGLVKHFKTPHDFEAEERRLIPVQGKPVSETILEERR